MTDHIHVYDDGTAEIVRTEVSERREVNVPDLGDVQMRAGHSPDTTPRIVRTEVSDETRVLDGLAQSLADLDIFSLAATPETTDEVAKGLLAGLSDDDYSLVPTTTLERARRIEEAAAALPRWLMEHEALDALRAALDAAGGPK